MSPLIHIPSPHCPTPSTLSFFSSQFLLKKKSVIGPVGLHTCGASEGASVFAAKGKCDLKAWSESGLIPSGRTQVVSYLLFIFHWEAHDNSVFLF